VDAQEQLEHLDQPDQLVPKDRAAVLAQQDQVAQVAPLAHRVFLE